MLGLDPDEKFTQESIFPNSTLTSPKTIIELPTKTYVDSKFNDPSIIKNTDRVDVNDKIIDNVHSIQVNSFPTHYEQFTPKIYVDNVVSDAISYVDNLHEINRNRGDLSSVLSDQDSEFDNNKLTNLDSFTVDRNSNSDTELANKNHIDDSI